MNGYGFRMHELVRNKRNVLIDGTGDTGICMWCGKTREVFLLVLCTECDTEIVDNTEQR
jgi:hypothetical protein